MKKRRTLIVTLLLVAVLALGIGYASVSNIILSITGNADVAADNANFKVVFTNPVSAAAANISVDTGATHNASIAVTGLKTVGEKATVYIDILNDDADSVYAAAITNINVVQDTEGYFKATVKNQDALLTTVLQPGEDVTVEIEIELLKVPTDPNATYTGHFTIDFTATPQTATP